MKYKYILSIAIIGMILYVAGAWAKITHRSYADKAIDIAAGTIIISLLLLLIKVISTKNRNSFLNK